METKTIAYCGYDCKNCPVYIATKNNDLELLKQIVITPGVTCDQTIENLGCFGCCSTKTINSMCINCPIRKCSQEQKLENCGWCDKFPCEKLNYISEKTMNYLKEIKKERMEKYEKN